jgi:hypothetical protein
VLSVFVSSVGGFIFYRISEEKLFPKTFSYVMGGAVCCLLSFGISAYFALVQWLYVRLLARLLVYVLFLVVSQRKEFNPVTKKNVLYFFGGILTYFIVSAIIRLFLK